MPVRLRMIEDFQGGAKSLQALMGGTTSIVGLDLPGPGNPPACINGLARNLDYQSGFHGDQTGREPIAWVLAGFVGHLGVGQVTLTNGVILP